MYGQAEASNLESDPELASAIERLVADVHQADHGPSTQEERGSHLRGLMQAARSTC